VRLVTPKKRLIALEPTERGYYQSLVGNVEAGSLYFYRIDGQKERPDPASRFQPQGVHGPSQVVASHFSWGDQSWSGLPLKDYIIYELHVGTFTPDGTFDAVIPHLDDLKDLGITAVEIMPVAQFPGSRNWGYDGVDLYAVQNSYGGPEGLKRLIDACHQRGLALILDVVYNHLGPEGNYLADFAPYFTERYRTPWGPAINFDGPDSDEVRDFYIQNALYWITDFHIDALRLDAVHAILDHSPRPFLQELAETVREQAQRLNRKIYLIPESAANDSRLIRSPELGGYGLDAQWNDDFHHSLRVLLTGERRGYYEDYDGLNHFVKAFREGFVYSGEYSPFRRHRHGSSSRDIPAGRFVVFAQNHDQVGNRMLGERLTQLVSFEKLKLAAGAVLLSPFLPLIFMGEEYGETAPFQYFISHSDPELVEAVRKGRREEFAAFGWKEEPPDPQSEATFEGAKLKHDLRHEGHHQVMLRFYWELIRLRKEHPALAQLSKQTLDVIGYDKEKVLLVRRWAGKSQVFAIFNFSEANVSMAFPVSAGNWRRRIDSSGGRWLGNGSQVPEELRSHGKVNLSLNSTTFVLFVSAEG
jgi:maltooligosyltrehalose trehalohydrolase